MPSDDVVLKRHQPVGANFGAKDVQSRATRKVRLIVELAASNGGFDLPHGVFTSATVLRRVRQARVLLAADALPGEVEEQLTGFCAYGHEWG